MLDRWRTNLSLRDELVRLEKQADRDLEALRDVSALLDRIEKIRRELCRRAAS